MQAPEAKCRTNYVICDPRATVQLHQLETWAYALTKLFRSLYMANKEVLSQSSI